MRVIAGKAKGKSLKAPEGIETRPTSDKTREAIFGSLQFEIFEARFLDLFAGSGAMGIEALSRGAEEAVFIDSSKAAIACIKDNLKTTGLNGIVIMEDSFTALSRIKGKFDFIFIDPPYKSGYYEKAIRIICERGLLNDGGKLILEHDGGLDTSMIECIETVKDKKYGKAHVRICVPVNG